MVSAGLSKKRVSATRAWGLIGSHLRTGSGRGAVCRRGARFAAADRPACAAGSRSGHASWRAPRFRPRHGAAPIGEKTPRSKIRLGASPASPAARSPRPIRRAGTRRAPPPPAGGPAYHGAPRRHAAARPPLRPDRPGQPGERGRGARRRRQPAARLTTARRGGTPPHRFEVGRERPGKLLVLFRELPEELPEPPVVLVPFHLTPASFIFARSRRLPRS